MSAISGPSAPGVTQSLLRGDPGYEDKRGNTVWQALKPDRHPARIVAAASEADVVNAVNLARNENLRVSVRAGGHSYVANFLRDDALLIDVSALQDIRVHLGRRVVEIGPGVRGAVLDAHLAAHDLAFPVPHVGSVGMAGYLLGGGMGWNGETWGGLACFNLSAVELVTADGRRLRAGPGSHPDLFWAARGAGPAFPGVVTRFHFEAFPRLRSIRRSIRAFPWAAVPAVAGWLHGAAAVPHPGVELTLILAGGVAPPDAHAPTLPSCLVSITCFADSSAEADARLEQITRSAPDISGALGEERHDSTIAGLLAENSTGTPRRIAADNLWTHRPVDALTVLAEHFARAPSPDSVVIANFRSLPGPAPDGAGAVLAPCYAMWLASWDSPSDDGSNLAWVDAAARLLEPYSAGCYINETDFLSRPERARRSFTPEGWRRLQAVRSGYDPQNRFHSF